MTTPEYQGISKSVMARLLAMASGYDRRFLPGEVDVAAFCEVAREWRWNTHEVETQIKKWGANRKPDEGMEPALLNRLIRDHRQDASMRSGARPSGNPMAAVDATGEAVGDDPEWGTSNSPDLEQVHREAVVVACPQCHQPIDERCRNTATGNATKIPHSKRMKAAGMGGRSRHANRALVLKHPDLVAELRKPPCSYTSPDTWSGYLPPERGPNGERNGSIYRRQIAAILAEADRRESAS